MTEEKQGPNKTYLPRSWDPRRRKGTYSGGPNHGVGDVPHLGPSDLYHADGQDENSPIGAQPIEEHLEDGEFLVTESHLLNCDFHDTPACMPACCETPKCEHDVGRCCQRGQVEYESETGTTQTHQKVKVTVCGIRFGQASRIYHFDTAELDLNRGDWVIVKTEKGTGLGCVALPPFEREFDPVQLEGLRKVLRKAGRTDFDQWERCKQREKDAHSYCLERISELGLPMKLVAAECFFDSSKYIFYFTAEGRVDFRELVKQLVARFPVRIEMRQIGVRHEAKMIGGLATCGQELCCSRFLTDFKPVSVRMAKTQNLSLNPTKISGVCGRLMCCLGYEHGIYEDFRKGLPKIGKTVKTRKGQGVVIKHNPLTETVFLKIDEETTIEVRREDVLEGWASVTGADIFDNDDHDDSEGVDFLADEP